MHYKVTEPADPAAQAILRETLQWLAHDGEMERDREHLVSVCCAPQRPVQLEGAPIPINIKKFGRRTYFLTRLRTSSRKLPNSLFCSSHNSSVNRINSG